MPKIEQLTRREVLAGGAAGVLTALGISRARAQEGEGSVVKAATAINLEAATPEFLQGVDQINLKLAEVLGQPVSITMPKPTGEPYSQLWEDTKEDKNRETVLRMVMRKIALEQIRSGQIKPFPALTMLDAKLPKLGLSQTTLTEGILGGEPIPQTKVMDIPVDQNTLSVVTQLGELFNANYQITASQNSGSANLFRVAEIDGDGLTADLFVLRQNLDPATIQTNGKFELSTIGIALNNAGLIPESAIIPKPETATGAGTTPTPEQTAQLVDTRPFKLFETTPQGKLTVDNFPQNVPQGQVGLKPRAGENAAQIDEFFNQLNVKVKFRPNPQLRLRVGTSSLDPCDNCTKTSETYGVLRGSVDPTDPRTLIMEFNIFRPDFQLDPAYREKLSDSIAGTIGANLSKVIYGGELWSDKLTQEQRNHIGQIAVRLEYEIKPLELVALTTG